MTTSDFDREWEKLAREVVSGMKEWRIQHPGDMEGAGRGARPAVESDAGAVAGGYGVGQ